MVARTRGAKLAHAAPHMTRAGAALCALLPVLLLVAQRSSPGGGGGADAFLDVCYQQEIRVDADGGECVYNGDTAEYWCAVHGGAEVDRFHLLILSPSGVGWSDYLTFNDPVETRHEYPVRLHLDGDYLEVIALQRDGGGGDYAVETIRQDLVTEPLQSAERAEIATFLMDEIWRNQDFAVIGSTRVFALSSYEDGTHDIYTTFSTDKGQSYSVPAKVGSSGGDDERYPTLACSATKCVLAYTREASAGSTTLRYVTSDDGESWSSQAQLLAAPTSRETSASVVATPTSFIVSFSNTSSSLNYVTTSDADGANWSAPSLIDGANAVGPYTAATLEYDVLADAVMAAWTMSPEDDNVWYSIFSEGSWTAAHQTPAADLNDDGGAYPVRIFSNTQGDFLSIINIDGTIVDSLDLDCHLCDGDPCGEHGTCQPADGSCVCDDGWNEDDCSNDIDYCALDPCINGVCVDLPTQFLCDCTNSGHYGVLCETPIVTEESTSGQATDSESLTATLTSDGTDPAASGSNMGVIIGGVAAGVVVIGCCVCVIFLFGYLGITIDLGGSSKPQRYVGDSAMTIGSFAVSEGNSSFAASESGKSRSSSFAMSDRLSDSGGSFSGGDRIVAPARKGSSANELMKDAEPAGATFFGSKSKLKFKAPAGEAAAGGGGGAKAATAAAATKDAKSDSDDTGDSTTQVKSSESEFLYSDVSSFNNLTVDYFKVGSEVSDMPDDDGVESEAAKFLAMGPMQLARAMRGSQYNIDASELVMQKTLGQGSFGVVKKAKYKGKSVAVKCIIVEVADVEKAKADFCREAMLSCNIPPHVNVVATVGISVDPLLLVLEYLGGGNLRDLAYNRSYEYDVAFIVSTMTAIAAGMLHLHSNGIVHRDLAARNILLSAQGVPKVADFGLARENKNDYLGEGVTQAKVGPIYWMAPECIIERKYSKRSDVWSFAVLFIELFSRRTPWNGREPMEVATQVSRGAHHTIPKTVPAVLAKVIKMCFARSPHKRPSFRDLHTYMKQVEKISKQRKGNGA